MPVVAGIAQSDGSRHGVSFLVMRPVEDDRKLPVVHAFTGELYLHRPGLGVLAEVALLRLLANSHEVVRSTDQVEGRYVGQILDGVVRSVQGAHRATKSRYPRSSKYRSKNVRVWSLFARISSRSSNALAVETWGGDRNRGVPRHELLPSDDRVEGMARWP